MSDSSNKVIKLDWKELTEPEKYNLVIKSLEKLTKIQLYEMTHGYSKWELINDIIDGLEDHGGLNGLLNNLEVELEDKFYD